MKRRLGVMALALTLALLGTSLVLAYVNHADARAVAGLHPTKVYVADRVIPAGTSLADAVQSGLAKLETVPQRTVPTAAVTQLTTSLRDKVAVTDIQAGQVLFAAAFGSKQVRQGGLPLPRGDLAVSVALADPNRVGNYVLPGSRVAIFDTYNTVDQLSNDGRLPSGGVGVAGDGLATGHNINHRTRLLLTDVLVLAVGAETAPASGPSATTTKAAPAAGSSSQPVLLTVAVKQLEAEKLVQGIQTGRLYLGLLGPDSSVAPSRGVDNTNLFN